MLTYIRGLVRTFPRIQRMRNWNLNSLDKHVTSPLARYACSSSDLETLSVTFIDRKGKPITVKTEANKTILDIVKDNKFDENKSVDFFGYGICDGTVACGTCHVILEESTYDELGGDDLIRTDELDMLDMVVGLKPTSRLGCQVTITKKMDGLTITIPPLARDVRKF